jgi:hypothetical protein
MIAFKFSPRCHGDVYVSRYEEQAGCLQCGYELRAEERVRPLLAETGSGQAARCIGSVRNLAHLRVNE